MKSGLEEKKGIRKNIYGTAEKPRITVFRSNKHIYVQAIDDRNGTTIDYSSDFEAKVKRNIDGAAVVGQKLAEKLIKKKIKEAVYDRNGYHPRFNKDCRGQTGSLSGQKKVIKQYRLYGKYRNVVKLLILIKRFSKNGVKKQDSFLP